MCIRDRAYISIVKITTCLTSFVPLRENTNTCILIKYFNGQYWSSPSSTSESHSDNQNIPSISSTILPPQLPNDPLGNALDGDLSDNRISVNVTVCSLIPI